MHRVQVQQQGEVGKEKKTDPTPAGGDLEWSGVEGGKRDVPAAVEMGEAGTKVPSGQGRHLG